MENGSEMMGDREGLMCEDGECGEEINTVVEWTEEANATAHFHCCSRVGVT